MVDVTPSHHPFSDGMVLTASVGSNLKAMILAALPKWIAGLSVFILFILLALLVRWVIGVRWQKHAHRHKYVVLTLVSRSLSLLILFIGAIVGLGTAGVGTASLVTSLGLTGFAVSYAMKDILTNVMAGALIVFNGTIKVGDELSINNNTGKVIGIDLRYTTLENETAKMLVPNGTLLTAISSISKPEEVTTDS